MYFIQLSCLMRACLQIHGGVLSTDGMELVTKDTVVLENIDTDKHSLI
jgi:hypothetical protein